MKTIVAKKTVIFDFDGTIVDTFEIVLDTLDQYSGDFGVEIADKKLVEDLRFMSILEIIKKFKIPKFMIPFILRKGQKDMEDSIESISPFPGVIKEIKKLKNAYNVGILTSNSKENVIKVLNKEGILDLFDFVYAEKTLFSKHKLLNKVIKKYKLDKKEVIYVGDEARDVEASIKAGVSIVSVGWGFNSKNLLTRLNSENYVDTPEEMTKRIVLLLG